MSLTLARVLSVVFHPLLIPTYLFAFLFYYLPVPVLSVPLQVRGIVLSMVIFTTFIIPGIGAYAMVRAGKVDNLEMGKREQRSLPLLFTGMCYTVTAYLLYRQPVLDRVFFFIMGVIAMSIFLTFVLSLFWKVSVHGIGLGGGLGLLLMLNKLVPEGMMLFPAAMSIIIVGAVLSARLALNAHTPAQIYAGFGSGFLLAVVAGAIAL